MDSLSYLHLEAANQEPPAQTSKTVGSSWNAQAWDEIFDEEEEEPEALQPCTNEQSTTAS